LQAFGRLGLAEERAGHRGVDIDVATPHHVDGLDDLRLVGPFDQVAVAAGAQGLQQHALLLVHGEEQYLQRGKLLLEAADGLDPALAGHADVEQDHVGAELLGEA
jgi:hypothetical protein